MSGRGSSPRLLGLATIAWGLVSTVVPSVARAQSGLLSPSSFSGVIDIRAKAAQTDSASWVDRGEGKSRFGEGTGIDLGEATLAWKPRFSSRVVGHLTVQYQPEFSPSTDIVEAYVSYRPKPGDPIALSARMGVFFPRISLEHDDLFWSTTDTITPSAINSWITEEIKVAGLEISSRHAFAKGELTLTFAAFQGNDTAGSLLAYRGWALHDLKPGLSTKLPLAAFKPGRRGLFPEQTPYTSPTREIDDRIGGYGMASWRRDGVSISLFHYDNAGDRVTLVRGQYAWQTRFTALSLRLQPSAALDISAQVVRGQTHMGPSLPEIPINIRFQAAYLMATVAAGSSRLAARIEAFGVDDRSFQLLDDQTERGAAVTLALHRNLTPQLQSRFEVLAIRSRRPDRLFDGVAARQTDVIAQAALRFSF